MINKTKSDPIEPFTVREKVIIQAAKESFAFFIQQVFPKSFEGDLFEMADYEETGEKHPFSLGEIHYYWAKIVQENPRVCILAPRMHLKSTILNHAFCMWQMFKATGRRKQGIVVSYNDDLARNHTKTIKELIRLNPFTRFWVDNKPTSESVVDYDVKFDEDSKGVHCTIDPYGVFGNLRGRHPNWLVCDDILTDFKNNMETTQISAINTVFRSSLSSLPNKNEPLLVIGTPQSYDDTLYMLSKNTNYVWGRFPAEDASKGEEYTLWPEKFNKERLKWQKKDVGPNAYEVEYLLVPALAVNSFLPQAAVEACVDPEMPMCDLNVPFVNPNNWSVYGGMDIGKEVHPTHISVGIVAPTGDIIQVYQKFLDGMDYRQQAKVVTQIVNHFGIKRFYFDATRGEFEDRVMSKKVLGKKFNKRLKQALALSMESRIFAEGEEPRIVLLDDQRQVRQMVAVDKELQSIETPEGHGDAFWSNALMIRAAEDGPVVTFLGDAQDTFGSRGMYKLPANLQQYSPVEAAKVYSQPK